MGGKILPYVAHSQAHIKRDLDSCICNEQLLAATFQANAFLWLPSDLCEKLKKLKRDSHPINQCPGAIFLQWKHSLKKY